MTTLSLTATMTVSAESASSKQESGFWTSIYNFFLPHEEERKILHEGETQYFHISIEEDSQKNRHLVFKPRKGSQGIQNPKDPYNLQSYYLRTATTALTCFHDAPKSILFIGLGAGIMPRFIRHYFPDTRIDIIEIDKEIPAIAEKYFDFKLDNKMNLTIGDGRVFIKTCKEKYDIIFLDAYNAEAIPFHLTTKEFFESLGNCLSKTGVASINIANLGKENFIASELLTLDEVFKYMAVYVTQKATNYVPIVSNNNPLNQSEMNKRADELMTKYKFKFPLKDYLRPRMTAADYSEFLGDRAILLTDDYSPVNTMD